MGERYLDVFATKMDDGIERFVVHPVRKEVAQSVSRNDAPTVEHDCQTRIEIGIVAKHQFDELASECVMLEQGRVRLEEDCGSVLVLTLFGNVTLEDAFAEDCFACLSVAETLDFESSAQSIDCL